MMPITYVSNRQLLRDIEEWATVLPRFDAYAGVPRGGTFIASYLACRLSAPLVSLDHLYTHDVMENHNLSVHIDPMNVTKFKPFPGHARILVVDDNVSVNTRTFTRIRNMLGGFNRSKMTICTATMYRSNPHTPVDYYFKDVSPPPIFEFDWFRRHYVQHAGIDFDGVLCPDYGPPEQEHPDPGYLNHLQNAKCRIAPGFTVKAIVTARLSRHRSETEKWLNDHGIRYKELIMYDSDSAQKRRERGDWWRHKADFLARPDVWFFAESNRHEAKAIWERTGKPVICTDTGEMFK